MQEEFAKDPNPIKTRAPKTETYNWTNKKTGEIHQLPKGIDPGFDYNPGAAPWGNTTTGA